MMKLGGSVTLKMNHMPGGALLLVASTAVFVLGFLPFLSPGYIEVSFQISVTTSIFVHN
jgi:hypothetical protein